MTDTLSLKSFNTQSRHLIGDAQSLADENHHHKVEPIHLLLSLLKLSEIREVLKKSNLQVDRFQDEVKNICASLPTSDEPSFLSADTLKILKNCEKGLGKGLVGIDTLFWSIVQDSSFTLKPLWISSKLDPDLVKANLGLLTKDNPAVGLSEYLTDLTLQAAQNRLDPVIGRDVELRRMIQILGRHHKHHPLLVGDPGVGKKTLMHALAQKMTEGNVPAALRSYTLYQLNTTALLSGSKLRGEVETRLKGIINDLKGTKAILYLHALDAFLSQNAVGGMGDLLTLLTSQSNLRLITSTTPEGQKKLADKDAHAHKRLSVLNLEPPSSEQAIEILRGVAKRYEDHHQIEIGEPAITAAVKLAKRYVQNKALPESAIDLLDEAASRKRMELDGLPLELDRKLHRLNSLKAQLTGLRGDTDQLSVKASSTINNEISLLDAETSSQLKERSKQRDHSPSRVLSEENVATVLGEMTGIPVGKILENDTAKFSKLEENLSARIIGQDEAVKAVCTAIRRSVAGLRDTKKPIGSFLFLGSSGSGKTLIAKALAGLLFDDEDAMIRFDMSEFGERHLISRLLGSPNGYQGSESGGQLTEAIKKRPYSVLLFDEVEKAHPDIFNILLQLLDDGRITDAKGMTVDCSHTLVIMTTNIGSKIILDTPQEVFSSVERSEELRLILRKELTTFLRPELLNRLDQQVIFAPLTKEGLKLVANIEIKQVEKLLFDREIKLSLSEEAREKLSHENWEPAYGARPLKRAILKYVQDPLSEMLLNGSCINGSKIMVSVSDGQFKLVIVK